MEIFSRLDDSILGLVPVERLHTSRVNLRALENHLAVNRPYPPRSQYFEFISADHNARRVSSPGRVHFCKNEIMAWLIPSKSDALDRQKGHVARQGDGFIYASDSFRIL